MDEDQISHVVIGAAIEVHRELGGPGLLEDIYEEALCRELRALGLDVRRQVRVPVRYKGTEMRTPLVLDVLVQDKVIVEVKAVEKRSPLHQAQLLTYLRLARKRLGLVINFGETRVVEGVQRVVNGL